MNLFQYSFKTWGLYFLFSLTMPCLHAQNIPVSAAANEMVDLLTGDFKYNLPVMTVPGPNGETVPIALHYQGGIRMEEQASWIGLGWDYNPGEISHQVHGVSDDWNGKKVTTVSTNSTTPFFIDPPGPAPGYYTPQKSEDTYYYGPLYFKNDNNYNRNDSKMDVGTSAYELPEGAGFSFPDYDTYSVSGPDIGGVMAPKVFAWGDFHMGDLDPYFYNKPSAFLPSKQVHFYFNNDINQFYVAQIGGSYLGPINTPTNRINTGTCVEYFTNSEINSNPSKFMDYRISTGIKRPAADFDPEGIGAFRITTPDGMTYHYSLPVYMLENEKTTSFILNNTFDIDNTEDKKEIIRTHRYAISWKLTAVTGLDYIDANNNGIVDIGDTGYWIAYNYGKWTNDYRWKSPFFNYYPNQYNKREPSNYRKPRYQLESYKNEGTVSTGQMQVYYLNAIQTATHSALFIKEVRLDAHAEKEGGAITPLLRLSKIVLVRNENLPLFLNNAPLPFDSRFSMAQCNPANVAPHAGTFNANAPAIKANALEAVEFAADYSLCKMVYNNIHNSFTTTSASYNAAYNTEIYKKYDEGAPASTSDLANSGKLTLNEIKLFGLEYNAVAPSYLLDYNQADPVKNPNYSLFRTDYWGYYKSDFNFNSRGHYTTEGANGSKNNVDAWSLKKITTPLNGEILIDYESDVYEKVNNGKAYVNPKRYFLIQSAALPINNPWVATVSKDIDDFINLPNVLYKEAFIPFVTGLTGGPYASCPAIAGAYGNSTSPPGFTLTALNSTVTTRDIKINQFAGSSINPSVCTGTYNPVYSPKKSGWGYIGMRFSEVSGGGVRVKQLTVKDPDNNLSYVNTYAYSQSAAGSEPLDISVVTDVHTIGKNNFANDPNMPPAVVTYGKVTVQAKSLQNTYNGKTEYSFDNMYDANTVSYRQIEPEAPDPTSTVPCSHVRLETFATVKQLVGAFGRPLRVTVFDDNDNIVSAESYEYYPLSEVFSPSVTETFTQQLREYGGNPFMPCSGAYDLLLDMDYTKIQCKNRLQKKTVFKDGIYVTEEFLDHDRLTGAVSRVRLTDPTIGITETVTDFAYTQPAYAAMGPKSSDPTAQNVLLAPCKVSVYRNKIVRDVYNHLVPDGSPELIGGSKTSWRQTLPKRLFDNSISKYVVQTQSSPDWKPYKTYEFNGDANDANWREVQELSLWNTRHATIESKGGVTNRFSATKLGYNQQYVLCEASDAKYTEFSFSGFEDQEIVAPGIIYFGGEITQGQMRSSGDATIKPHTGNYLAKVDAGAYGPGYFTPDVTPGRSYRASVWVHKNSPANAALVLTLDGSRSTSRLRGGLTIYKNIEKSDPSNTSVGDWILMTLTLDVPADYVATGGTLNDFRAYLYNPGNTTAYFDDFAIRPLDLAFEGNVIDEKSGRTTAVLDTHNFATKYVYDKEGRVSEVWTESATDGWKLKQQNTYNFKRAY